MSISGMTGFARAEGELPEELGGLRWTWEAKSVNGRGLDLKLRLPPGFDALEQPARALTAKLFKRGSLQATLTLARDPAKAAPLRLDIELVERLLEAGEPFIKGKRVKRPRWDGLLAVRGVVVGEDGLDLGDEERSVVESALLAGLEAALNNLAEARAAEGRMLAGVLSELTTRMDVSIGQARNCAGAAPAAALQRIRQRLTALAPEVQLDPQRMAQEAALAASRADVQEELERLAAHATELRALLKKPEPAGRRLEFLGQELTREANTLCSKSVDLELTRVGLELKAIVDQIKEQAANVE
jgi:uncharacterized protein (TIGR00255 family)